MNILQGLNPQQKKAVQHLDGPLLILAGAGSGKTRVLTNRVAWLIGEKGVSPWQICAITFTNKAAGEMRDRVDKLVGFGSEAVHVATFHSTCVRILRRYIDRLGYQRNFDIYDTDDTKSLMKDICRHLDINTKLYKEKMFLSRISHQKDELIGPEQYHDEAVSSADQEMLLTSDVYAEYQKRLRRSNALDFDDLIFLTVELFRQNPDVLDHYRELWRYLMVDEYQDTNKAQFVFTALLAGKYRNLCVVGDDDQSIYRFRGADIGNILNFEQIFPDAEVIRLEQNYRSTQNILDAANSVIANNKSRKAKKLWTSNGSGDPVRVIRFDDARQEAKYIVDDIARKKRQHVFSYKDSAVLYRTNAQSRSLEEQLIYENIPYTIIGGTSFYSRREVKDILAYLKAVDNSSDDVAVKRIINVPKRGIGQTSVQRADAYAQKNGLSFFDVCRMADKVPGIGRGGLKMRSFARDILALQKKAMDHTPSELIREIIEQTGYATDLKAEGTEEAKERLANIDELINKAVAYEDSLSNAGSNSKNSSMSDDEIQLNYISDEDFNMSFTSAETARETDATPANGESGEPTLRGFLEQVALVADIDSLDSSDERVALMTLHAAKGLEFPNVYIAGMDDGMFPSFQATVSADPSDMEEERRLCYVGITRAKEHLTLTGARMRLVRGQLEVYRASRFLDELPHEAVDSRQMGASPRGTYASSSGRTYSARRDEPYGRRLASKPDKPIYLMNNKPAETATGTIGYAVGDAVRHVKFGRGVVLDIRDGGRDKEVTVNFDNYGVKKMFAGFAKLVKE